MTCSCKRNITPIYMIHFDFFRIEFCFGQQKEIILTKKDKEEDN